MTDFDYDVKCKKDVARSASHRVGNRKGCTMPSDFLTAKQKRDLNGDTITLNLNKPMEWKQFLQLPRNLRREYIVHLQRTYGASQHDIMKMFGVSQRSVSHQYKYLAIPPISRRDLNAENRRRHDAAWDAFLNGDAPEAASESKTDEAEEFHAPDAAEAAASENRATLPKFTATRLDFSFCVVCNAETIGRRSAIFRSRKENCASASA